MPKLTDTQLVILSTAANREDRTVMPLPKSLKIKGAAVTKTLETMLNKGLVEEKSAPRGATAWRKGKDGQRVTLVITKAGLGALEGGPGRQPSRANARSKKNRVRAKPKTADVKINGVASAAAVRPGTKQAKLVDLLKRENGATIDDAVAALGWQAHSVRGAISGALKKKLGLAVSSVLVYGRGRVYRIVERG